MREIVKRSHFSPRRGGNLCGYCADGGLRQSWCGFWPACVKVRQAYLVVGPATVHKMLFLGIMRGGRVVNLG